MGREVGAGREPVASRRSRGHRRDRALAVRPDDVHRAVPVLRQAEQLGEPPDPLEPEAPADRVEASRASPRDRRAGRRAQLSRARRARLGSPRASRARPRRPPAEPSRRSPRWRACARRARPRSRSFTRRSSSRAATRSRVELVGGEDLDGADAGDDLPPAAGRELETGEPADELVGLALGARREHRLGLDAGEVAPAPQGPGLLDRRADLGLGGVVEALGLHGGEGGDDETPLRARGQVAPDLLGHERDERVGEREHALEHEQQDGGRLLLAVVEARLDDLQVPVAELGPDEAVELEHGVGEVVGVERWRRRARPCAPGARGSSGPRRGAARGAGGDLGGVQEDRAAKRSRACWRGRGPARPWRSSSARPGSTTSPEGRSAARRRRGDRSPRGGRCRCRGSSTSGARPEPGSPSACRRPRTGCPRRTRCPSSPSARPRGR